MGVVVRKRLPFSLHPQKTGFSMEILGVDFCIIGRNEKYLLARKPVSPKCEDLPG